MPSVAPRQQQERRPPLQQQEERLPSLRLQGPSCLLSLPHRPRRPHLQLIFTLLTAVTCLFGSPTTASYHQSHWQHNYFSTPSQWMGSSSGKSRPGRLRAGQGSYRIVRGIAELECHFPSQYQIISNIIWERGDLSPFVSLDQLYKSAGEELRYKVTSWPQGTRLELSPATSSSRGLYRCLATALSPRSSRQTLTIFQDVPFYPDIRPKWLEGFGRGQEGQRPPDRACCSGPAALQAYRDFAHRSEYHVKSSYYVQ